MVDTAAPINLWNLRTLTADSFYARSCHLPDALTAQAETCSARITKNTVAPLRNPA